MSIDRKIRIMVPVAWLIFLTFSVAQAAPDSQSCARLTSLALPNTRILVAEVVSPNPTWPFPSNMITREKHGIKTATVPFCRVTGVIETEINFEVWLPEEWNGKFEGIGNFGFAGAMVYQLLDRAMMRHYASGATDTGHINPSLYLDSSWIDGHPERVDNLAYRAHHLLAINAKKIVAAYYGQAPLHAYFEGCSLGGWEALTEAQQYPQDYDGIVAGAPAIDFVRHETRGLWLARLSLTNPSDDLSAAKIQRVINAFVQRCDAADGVKDGIVNNPEQCDFDPAQLLCSGGETSSCLTAGEVKRAHDIWNRHRTEKGLALFPGNAYGGLPVARQGADSADIALQTPALHRMLPDWDLTPANFDADRDIPLLEGELGAKIKATDPDLSAFAARNGKLILYHGWNDASFSPYNTIDYYRAVQAAMGKAKTAQFSRLYMLPGLEHCMGGPGAMLQDALGDLETWVEQGKAPDQLLTRHKTPDGTVDWIRPVCPYPQSAKYTGHGSTSEPGNFVCAGP